MIDLQDVFILPPCKLLQKKASPWCLIRWTWIFECEST